MAHLRVSPETFTMVDFDADEIHALGTELIDAIGFPDDLDIEIRVDETVPLGRVRVASIDPLVLEVDGGAFEDPKRLRQFSSVGARRVIGRLLFQAQDLRNPDFGAQPDRDELSLEQRVAWDVYAMGRVARLGIEPQKQRWSYAFRTRHGFNDDVDRAFERLWTSSDLTWPDIAALDLTSAS